MIEQCFGQIKRRFPILQYGVQLQMDLIPKCSISCFIMHNMTKMLNNTDDFDDWVVLQNRTKYAVDALIFLCLQHVCLVTCLFDRLKLNTKLLPARKPSQNYFILLDILVPC